MLLLTVRGVVWCLLAIQAYAARWKAKCADQSTQDADAILETSMRVKACVDAGKGGCLEPLGCVIVPPDPFSDPLGNSTYHVGLINKHNRPENWDYCRGLGRFSQLVAIETAEEQQHVASLVSASGCMLAWLSATAIPSGSDTYFWEFHDGSKTPMTYTQWGSSEPNNWMGTMEDAVTLLSENGGWADSPMDMSSLSPQNTYLHCAVCEYIMI